MRDQLDALEQAAQAAGMVVYRGWPTDMPTADWPDNDVTAFLDVAQRLDAPLLYLAGLTATDLAGLDGVDIEEAGVDPDRLVMVAGGWVVGGVLHALRAVDPEWNQLADDAALDADVARFRTQVERHERDELVEEAARKVVTDPVFWDHGGPGRDAKQLAAIRRLLPDLPEELHYVVRSRARAIDFAEYKDAREAEWARRARQLLEAGKTKRATAEELGITTSVLGRVLQTH